MVTPYVMRSVLVQVEDAMRRTRRLKRMSEGAVRKHMMTYKTISIWP